jgi:hypothetical protein
VAWNNYNDIELFIKEIDLPFIKYTEHNKFINQESNLSNSEEGKPKPKPKPIPTRNPKFGVFDVETFIDTDTTSDGVNYSRVFVCTRIFYQHGVNYQCIL